MSKAPKYSTIGGHLTRGEVYAQLLDRVRECQDLSAMMGHLHNTESNDMDKLLAKGWLGVSEMFKGTADMITNMAMRKLQ